MAYIDQSKSAARYVEIENVCALVAYEEPHRASDPSKDKCAALRLAGYCLSRLPHGIQCGGAINSVLFKNLNLLPRRGARGERIDLANRGLAALALKLHGRIGRAARYPAALWQPLTLPPVWAGFHRQQAMTLSGTGPELERVCRRTGRGAAEVLRSTARSHDGLHLLPLEWIDDVLDEAVAIFVEMTPRFWRPVFRVPTLPEGLVGFQGASAFDFYNSRFRCAARQRRVSTTLTAAMAQLPTLTGSQESVSVAACV